MAMIDLDDQIRMMAAIIAAGMMVNGEFDEGLARDAVELAAAIHNEVHKSEWSFTHGRKPKGTK